MNCQTDWVATGTMLYGIAAWLAPPAIVGAALIGKSAVSDWRAEKVASREVEAAEQALSAAYRAKDAVEGIRGRFITGGELSSAEDALKAANEDFESLVEDQKKAYVRRGVFYRRAEFFKDDFNAVFEAIPAAKIFFGDDVEQALRKFAQARHLILTSADMLPMMAGMSRPEDEELQKKINRDLYGKWMDTDEDRVGQLVDEAINTLDTTLLPKLRASNR